MSIGPRQQTIPNGRPRLVVVDAPSNLGLRPPEAGAVPGCYKAPWVLRNLGLQQRLGAEDGGCVVPPRYRAAWQPGDGDRNAGALVQYTLDLAQRVTPLLLARQPVLLLGGDCSVLIGVAHALRHRGRPGLVFMDAHSDFRHSGQGVPIGAAAGEDLAIVTGRGDPRLVALGGREAPFRAEDVFVLGIRDADTDLAEMVGLGMQVTTAGRWQGSPSASIAALDRWTAARIDGFWVHLDLDVVDASEMPAADCPETGGPSFMELATVLARLSSQPGFLGLDLTIYDPDLDPQGVVGRRIVDCLVDGLRSLQPDASTDATAARAHPGSMHLHHEGAP